MFLFFLALSFFNFVSFHCRDGNSTTKLFVVKGYAPGKELLNANELVFVIQEFRNFCCKIFYSCRNSQFLFCVVWSWGCVLLQKWF
jgi:hypothetical protein